MNPLQALYERARQEWAASDKDTIPNPLAGAGLGPAQVGYNPARDVPVVGGLINRTVNGPLHALGLLQESAGNAAQGIGGGAMLLAALAQVKAADAGMVDPNNTATQAARLALAQGFGHPGRALEAARGGPDTPTALLAGGLELAANPLNYAGGIGEFGRGVEAGAPLAGRAIQALAHTGHAANELPVSPIRALLAARRADQGERAAAAGSEVLRALLGREAPAADAAGAVARSLADVPVETSGGVPLAGLDLPLAPERRNYNAAAKLAGLPPAAFVKPEASPLAPQNFSVLRAARELARDESAALPAAVPGQLGLPPESGAIPDNLQRLGLDQDQFDFLDELRGAVQRGKQPEIAAARAWATDVMGIPTDRVGRTIEEAYQSLDVEDRAARLAAIEGSPYFEAFPYFKRDGALRPVNPTNGKRIPGAARALEQVWNLPGSGYDEVADGILARFQAGGHNQNYGQSTDDFWRGAQDAFKEYQALKKPAATATLPEVLSGGIPASSPLTPEITPEVGPDWTHYGPETLYPGEDVTPELLDRFASLRRFPNATAREIEDALGWARNDVSKLVSTAYNDVPKAIGNARTKYADPAALVQRSVERINASEALRARLWERDPELARRAGIDPLAAALPENAAAGATPPPINAQGYSIDEIVARHTPAPTPLSNVDIPPAPTDPAERAAWQARYVGQSQSGTDILAAGDKVAGGDLTQADLNALSPQERMAALRKLAGGGDLAAGGGGFGLVPNADNAGGTVARVEDRDEFGRFFRYGNAIDVNANWKRLALLPDDQPVVLYHATSRENAARILREGYSAQGTSSRFTNSSPDHIYLGDKANLGTYIGYQGHGDGVFVAFEVPKAALEPDMGSDWLSYAKGARRQLKAEGVDINKPSANDTYRHINQVRVPKNIPRPLGIVDPNTDEFIPIARLDAKGMPLGLLPTRLGTTLAGAGVGTGVGAAIGAATDEDDRLGGAAKGALAGAVLGGNVGAAAPELARVTRQLAQASQGTMRSPTMYARAWRAGLAGQAEAAQAAGPRGLGGFVKALPAQWRSSVVMTFKQIPQDAITRWVTLWGIAKKELGVADPDIARWQETIASQRDAGAPLDTPVEQTLRALGQDRLATPAGIHEVYGTDFLSAEAARRRSPLNRGQSAAAGAIFGAFNGLRQVNPLSVAAGAAKGRYQPFINGFVQFLNGVQHDAFRYAMAEKTLARDIPPLSQALIADLQARGVDVAPLVAQGDYFSGADVAAVAGEAVGQRWGTLVEETIRNGGDRVAFLAGDFRDKAMLPGEKALAAVFPFVRWPLHYGPVFAEIAANHPRLAAVAVGILANQRAQAKQAGSKAYEAATTPITTEAPVLGGLARLRLGGQKGVLRAGLLGAVVPYANLAGGVDLPGEDASLYEKATAVGDAIGFSPNPLIQSGAYATGLDYRAPGALSRTAGLEGAAGLLPGPLGRLSMPAPGAALDAAREALTGQSGEYDPVMRRYAELVLDHTGKELAADENEPYLAFTAPGAQALYDRAKREVLTAGAVGNLASVASPVSLAARSAEGEAIRAAKASAPYSAAQIAGSSPGVALLMRAANDRYAMQAPATRAYRGASASAREDLLLGDIADRSPTNSLLDAPTRRQLTEAQRREIRRTQPR